MSTDLPPPPVVSNRNRHPETIPQAPGVVPLLDQSFESGRPAVNLDTLYRGAGEARSGSVDKADDDGAVLTRAAT